MNQTALSQDAPAAARSRQRLEAGLLEALCEASPDGILVVSEERRLLAFNRRFVDMWGIPEDVLHTGLDEKVLATVQDKLIDPQRFHARVAYLYQHPEETSSDAIPLTDGRTFERYSAAVRGVGNAVYGRVWFFRDVTDRLTAEAASAQLIREQAARENVLRHTARLRALHEAALTIAAPIPAEPEAVASLLARVIRHAVEALEGRDGRIVLAENAAWQELVPGSSPADGLVLLDHDESLRRMRLRPRGATAHVLASGRLVLVEDTMAPDAYGPYPKLAQAGIGSFVVAPLVADQHVLGALSVTFGSHRQLDAEDRDALQLFAAHAATALERVRLAAERQAALRDLAKQEAEAEALRHLDQLRSNLLLMISHELRTPLTLIHGYAELLQARIGSLSPEAAQTMAGRIHAGSTQLARLMDGLLDFTHIKHGDVLIRPVVFDLVSVLEDVVNRFRVNPGGDRLVFLGTGRLTVRADQERIAQALSNLIENALTYAPEGPIVVRVRAAERTVEGGCGGQGAASWVRVEVEDEGPGLPLDEQSQVWDSFFRGARVAGLNVAPGSGIGLATVKALVETHGGAVGLESVPGRGACFWFELPAAAEVPAQGPDRPR